MVGGFMALFLYLIYIMEYIGDGRGGVFGHVLFE